MPKFITYLVFFACAGVLSNADAAFVIKLRNGNEFVTGRYWHAGKQIMFDTYGGAFGIDKAFVIKIEPSDKPVQPMSDSVKTPEASPEADRAQKSNDTKKPTKASQASAKTKREDDPIMKDFYALQEKFAKLDSMLTSEIVEFSKDISDFKRKVQKSGKSNDYINEFTEAFKMGDAVEAALKARHQ
jgi:hypothetical protein